ncbi:hypothetical protein TrRE_jg5518 [Triparma retinervis]|uniref:Protein phosphatase n=1 Tax=Triparma retinervis TaxID=2557542 RepID=A0A9W7DSA1_9STRA|nr:hypothetical protein TrRE_jg5518 [Triparma retinervis]
MPRPPEWSVNATARRIEFDDPKFSTAAFKNYRDEDLEKVFKVMGGNTIVETVNVSTCKVGDAASRSMREAFSENCNIVEASFSNCVIAPKKLKRILQGLVYNSEEGEVQDLSFVDCAIDDRGARYFDELWVSPPPDDRALMNRLTTLNLERNKIGDKGAIAVSYLLTPSSNLTKLFLARNRIGDRGASALGGKLRKNKMLHTLGLGFNVIGPGGGIKLARSLAENKYLVALELQSNRIGAAGASELAKVLDKDVIGKSALSTLDISCNNIGDVGGAKMQELSEQAIVGNIVLHGNQVGVCTCKHCVLTPNTDPTHWCYEVGKFEVEILGIDDNGGNLTTANNTGDGGGDNGSSWGREQEGRVKLTRRIVEDTGPKKVNFKPPKPKIDANGKRLGDAGGLGGIAALRSAGEGGGGNLFENQLGNIMGILGGAGGVGGAGGTGGTGGAGGGEPAGGSKPASRQSQKTLALLTSQSTPNLLVSQDSPSGSERLGSRKGRRESKALAEIAASNGDGEQENKNSARQTTIPTSPIQKRKSQGISPPKKTMALSVTEMLELSRKADTQYKNMAEDASFIFYHPYHFGWLGKENEEDSNNRFKSSVDLCTSSIHLRRGDILIMTTDGLFDTSTPTTSRLSSRPGRRRTKSSRATTSPPGSTAGRPR